MRISVQRKVREIGQSRSATVTIDFTIRPISPFAAYRRITCATSTSSK
jgi:hypothetical protein